MLLFGIRCWTLIPVDLFYSDWNRVEFGGEICFDVKIGSGFYYFNFSLSTFIIAVFMICVS